MGFRMRKSIKVGPGVRLNVSKTEWFAQRTVPSMKPSWLRIQVSDLERYKIPVQK
jgi:hypothetical protein